MGLFNWGRNRKKGDELDDLSEYAGMRLEVMDGQENLLFVAHADVSWDGVMSLRPVSALRVPPGTVHLSVMLRGYQPSVKKAVHMAGGISPRADGSWAIEDLKITGKDNDRAFYRQETNVTGTVMPMRQRGVDELPCRVVNISAGGVCLQTAAECMIGEKLLLRTSLFPGWKVVPLMCAVRRATRRRNVFEYGCEFLDLTPAMDEAISKAILEMQLRRLHRGES